MACDFSQLTHPGIQTLSPYIPGKSAQELAEEQGLTDIIKLASNENPLGCSHLVSKALANLSGHAIAAYPSPAHSELLKALTLKHDVEPSQIILSCGSDLLFPLITNCFALKRQKHILTHDYAFASYAIYAKILGVEAKSVPVKENFEVDIETLIDACDENTAVIFLPNPNNPTGLPVSQKAIKTLLQNIPESTLLVLDEAYAEYQDKATQLASIELIKRYKNLVVTRTFSKAYGLAGLRIGYGITSPEVASLLLKINPPFIVSEPALTSAKVALEDAQFINETLKLNQQGLAYMQHGLADLGLATLPTAANFITVRFDQDAGPIYQNLLHKGIIVRPLHAYGLEKYLRVSIGTMQQNSRFLEALPGCIKDAAA